MRQIQLAPRAQEDILEITDYTLRPWGEGQVNRYIDSLNERFIDLVVAPRQFPRRSDAGRGMRSARYRAHIIFFRETKAGILIIRVLHHKQDHRHYLAVEDDLS